LVGCFTFATHFQKVMYAIVNIAGQQFKVEENQEIFVHRQDGNEGDKLEFNEVLLKDTDGAVQVGTPTVAAASVSATILNHLKGDKVIIFKKKRRKGYRVKNGHRQYLTKIKIDKIN
jgi:large subunit ribosomal protein L21